VRHARARLSVMPDQAAGKRAGRVNYEKREKLCSIYTSHTHCRHTHTHTQKKKKETKKQSSTYHRQRSHVFYWDTVQYKFLVLETCIMCTGHKTANIKHTGCNHIQLLALSFLSCKSANTPRDCKCPTK